MAARPKTFGDVPNPPLDQATVAVLRAYENRPRGSGVDGPGSIVAASAYMELYDEELDAQPSDLGLHTIRLWNLPTTVLALWVNETWQIELVG